MEYKDYYKTMGVSRSATPEEIKRSFRKLAMKYHPDKNPGDKQAEDKFKEINEANEVLSDPQKRARYDQLGESYNKWQQTGGAPGNFNWGDWSTQGGGRVDMGNLEDLFGRGFSDFFNSIFGGMGQVQTGRGSVRTPRTRRYEQAVQITLEEAFSGTQRVLQLETRRLEVKIPPGAQTGTHVRMKGAVSDGSDIDLVVEVLPHTRFERKGNDLNTEISVDMLIAILGGQAQVQTMTGNVMLTIPAGTQNGQTFRLAGKGMPHLRSPQTVGDLYVRVKIQMPRKLTSRQRELFEQLRQSDLT